jgi:hypothetical protein
LVQLRFKPLWLYVDKVREFCGFFARSTFDDASLGERVALIVHELIENAIRYGDDQELDLRIERVAESVVIAVANTATAEDSLRLKEVFDQLMSQPAQDAYMKALIRAPGLPQTESGIGLPRVRFEGQVDLELDISPGRVCVTARGKA